MKQLNLILQLLLIYALGISLANQALANQCCYTELQMIQGTVGERETVIELTILDPDNYSAVSDTYEPLTNEAIKIHINDPQENQKCYTHSETTDYLGQITATCISPTSEPLKIYFQAPKRDINLNQTLSSTTQTVYFKSHPHDQTVLGSIGNNQSSSSATTKKTENRELAPTNFFTNIISTIKQLIVNIF